MFGRLLLLLTLVPAVEIFLLATVAGHVGTVPTLGIVFGTGLLGAWLARREGFRVLRAWQGAAARGEIPREGVVSSLLVFVGGVLLVTPGVLTDLAGLLLLVPPTRRWVAGRLRLALERRFALDTVAPQALIDLGTPPAEADVIDVDAREADPAQPSP